MSFKEFREEIASIRFSKRHILKLRSLLFDFYLYSEGSRGAGRMTMAELAKDVEVYAEAEIDEETVRRFVMGYIWDKEDRNVSRFTVDAALRFCIESEEIEFDFGDFNLDFAEGVSLDGWPIALMRNADYDPAQIPGNLIGHFWHQASEGDDLTDTFLHIEPGVAQNDDEAGCFADIKLQSLRSHGDGGTEQLASIETSIGRLLYTTDGVVFGAVKNLATGANSFLLSVSEVDECEAAYDPGLALFIQGEPDAAAQRELNITKFSKINTKNLTEKVKYYRKSLRGIKKNSGSLFPKDQFRFSRENEATDFATFLSELAEKEGLAQNDEKGREAMPNKKTLREEFGLEENPRSGLVRMGKRAVRRDDVRRLRELIDQGLTGNDAEYDTVNTVLHEAASENARECVRLLITTDIRYDLRTHRGKLASDLTTDDALKRLLQIKERRDMGRSDVHRYPNGATWETQMAYYKARELEGAQGKVRRLKQDLETARSELGRLEQSGSLTFRALDNS